MRVFLAKPTQALEHVIFRVIRSVNPDIAVAQCRSTSVRPSANVCFGESQIRVAVAVGSYSGSIHGVSSRLSGFVRGLRILKFRMESSAPVCRGNEYFAQLLELDGVGSPKDSLAQRVDARHGPTECNAKALRKHFVSTLSILGLRLLRQIRCHAAIRTKAADFHERLFLLPELVHFRASCIVVKGVYCSAVFA
jgi:hypothetical protein